METRKVQLSGGTTYTVSLPKSWAEEHSVTEESSVALHPHGDGSLLLEVTGDADDKTRRAVVDVSTTATDALPERLLALYQVGFDEVTLRDRSGHTADRRLAVEDAISGLSGFELLETSEQRIQLTTLIDADNVDVRKSVLRLKLVTLSMHRDAVSAVVDADADLAARVIDRDTEADKLFTMITRHFRRSLTDLQEVKKLRYDRDELFEYYYIARQFERISDHAEKMSRFVVESERRLPDGLDEYLQKFSRSVRSIIDDAADVPLADADVGVADNVLQRRDDLLESIGSLDRDLYNHTEADEAYTAGLLLDSIRRSAQYGANIAEMGIQQHSRTHAVGREGVE